MSEEEKYTADGEQTDEGNKKKKKPGKLFYFFTGYGDGKGVDEKDVIEGYSVKNAIKLYGRRFRQLVTINWYYVFGNFPVLFFLLAISGNFGKISTAPASEIFPVIHGISLISGTTPSLGALLGIHGGTVMASADNVFTYILYGIAALFLLTFGLVNTGCAYLLKNIVKGEHVFIWGDFIGAIKTNFWQAIILGIFDTVMLGLCAYSLVQYLYNYETMYIMFYCMIVTLFLYLFIRNYMYILLVTFKLSVFKIIKNAFIFAISAFMHNLITFLFIAFLALMVYFLYMLYIPIAIILLIMIFFSTVSYIAVYSAYPKIDELMIKPYYKTPSEPKKSLLDD